MGQLNKLKKVYSGHPTYLQILKRGLQILANHYHSFDTDFKVLGQNW